MARRIPSALKGVVDSTWGIINFRGAQRLQDDWFKKMRGREFGREDCELFADLVGLPLEAAAYFSPLLRLFCLKLIRKLASEEGRLAKEQVAVRVESLTVHLGVVESEKPEPNFFHRILAFILHRPVEDVIKGRRRGWEERRRRIEERLERAEAYYRSLPGGAGVVSLDLPLCSRKQLVWAFAAAAQVLSVEILSEVVVPIIGSGGLNFLIYREFSVPRLELAKRKARMATGQVR